MGIGAKLEHALTETGISVTELSSLSGIPKSTIYSMIDRDNSRLDIDILLKICQALNITTDEFLSFDEYDEQQHILRVTNHEKQLVIAYRNDPDMQPAVDRLLRIDESIIVNKSEASENTVTVRYAARGPQSQGAGTMTMTQQELEALKNAPSHNDMLDD